MQNLPPVSGPNDRSTLNSLAQEMVPGDIVICIRSVEQIEAIGVVSGPYRFEQEVPSGIREDYQHVRPVNWLYTDVGLSILPLNDDVRFTLKTIYPMDRFSWGDLLSAANRASNSRRRLVRQVQMAKSPMC